MKVIVPICLLGRRVILDCFYEVNTVFGDNLHIDLSFIEANLMRTERHYRVKFSTRFSIVGRLKWQGDFNTSHKACWHVYREFVRLLPPEVKVVFKNKTLSISDGYVFPDWNTGTRINRVMQSTLCNCNSWLPERKMNILKKATEQVGMFPACLGEIPLSCLETWDRDVLERRYLSQFHYSE